MDPAVTGMLATPESSPQVDHTVWKFTRTLSPSQTHEDWNSDETTYENVMSPADELNDSSIADTDDEMPGLVDSML